MSASPERPCARAPHWRLPWLLRDLLDEIPWRDRADAEEQIRYAAPASGRFRVHNPKGHTRISGEDREDIQVTALKAARAESTAAAGALLRDIRLVFTETAEGAALDIRVPRKWNRRCCANLTIQLPRALHVAVVADNGTI
jgi:hypothetical protein